MQAIILILRAIDKKRSLIVKRHSSISTRHLFFLTFIFKFLLLEICHQFFIVFFADVTEQQVIERFDVGIGAISNDVYGRLRAE